MYCRNCGKEIAEQAVICISCGCSPLAGKKYCQNCAAETDPSAVVCVKCGVKLATRLSAGNKSKIVRRLNSVQPPVAQGSFVCHLFHKYKNLAEVSVP